MAQSELERLDEADRLYAAMWAGNPDAIILAANTQQAVGLTKQIRELVKSGKLESVSRFVQHAVAVALADIAGWGAMLGLALEQTGGPLRAQERKWADTVLRPPVRSRTKSKPKRDGKVA